MALRGNSFTAQERDDLVATLAVETFVREEALEALDHVREHLVRQAGVDADEEGVRA